MSMLPWSSGSASGSVQALRARTGWCRKLQAVTWICRRVGKADWEKAGDSCIRPLFTPMVLIGIGPERRAECVLGVPWRDLAERSGEGGPSNLLKSKASEFGLVSLRTKG